MLGTSCISCMWCHVLGQSLGKPAAYVTGMHGRWSCHVGPPHSVREPLVSIALAQQEQAPRIDWALHVWHLTRIALACMASLRYQVSVVLNASLLSSS